MSYKILERIKERTGLPYSRLETVYSEYFTTVKSVFMGGNHPGVVLTGLMSFQLSASAIKHKCKKLTEVILDENLVALKKRFKVVSLEDARLLLTNLIRIYKMKKQFDIQNILAKRRENNGWE